MSGKKESHPMKKKKVLLSPNPYSIEEILVLTIFLLSFLVSLPNKGNDIESNIDIDIDIELLIAQNQRVFGLAH